LQTCAVDSSEVGRTWGSAAAAVHDRAVCYLVAGRFWLRLPLDAQERKVA
jgi:hypothetical protein